MFSHIFLFSSFLIFLLLFSLFFGIEIRQQKKAVKIVWEKRPKSNDSAGVKPRFRQVHFEALFSFFSFLFSTFYFEKNSLFGWCRAVPPNRRQGKKQPHPEHHPKKEEAKQQKGGRNQLHPSLSGPPKKRGNKSNTTQRSVSSNTRNRKEGLRSPTKRREINAAPSKKEGISNTTQRRSKHAKQHHPTEDKGKVGPPRTPPKEGGGKAPPNRRGDRAAPPPPKGGEGMQQHAKGEGKAAPPKGGGEGKQHHARGEGKMQHHPKKE